MLRSQRRRRRIKRPNIINSLKRKAGQVIDPTRYIPIPLPVPLYPVRDVSKKFNPTMRRYHSTNRANSNSSQGSMSDFSKIAYRAFPGKTQEEIRDFVKTVTENRRDFEKRVTSQKEFREAVNKALPDKSIEERRKFVELVTSKRTTPRISKSQKLENRRRRRMLNTAVVNAAGKKSRKRRK